MDLDVPVNHRVNLKEREKDNYRGLDGNCKKLWNMKVTWLPNVTGALGTVIKGLVKGQEDLEIRGRVESI